MSRRGHSGLGLLDTLLSSIYAVPSERKFSRFLSYSAKFRAPTEPCPNCECVNVNVLSNSRMCPGSPRGVFLPGTVNVWLWMEEAERKTSTPPPPAASAVRTEPVRAACTRAAR